MKKVGGALSSTPRMWETIHGDHSWWTRTGTLSAKPSTKASRERSGKKLYFKVCGQRQGGQHSPAEHQSQRQDLWKMREAKANGSEYYNQGSGRQIASRVAAREALWEKHLQSPVSSLEEALRKTAAGPGRVFHCGREHNLNVLSC